MRRDLPPVRRRDFVKHWHLLRRIGPRATRVPRPRLPDVPHEPRPGGARGGVRPCTAVRTTARSRSTRLPDRAA